MSDRTVSIEDMAEAINEGLEEYADLAADEMKAAVKKTAKSVKEEISANAPEPFPFSRTQKSSKNLNESQAFFLVL